MPRTVNCYSVTSSICLPATEINLMLAVLFNASYYSFVPVGYGSSGRADIEVGTMSIVAILSLSHCGGEDIARSVADRLGYRLVSDDLIRETSDRFGVSADRIVDAINGTTSLFRQLSKERNRVSTALRATLADLACNDKTVYHGPAGVLLPRDIDHVLRVGIVADIDYRISSLVRSKSLSAKDARSEIKKDDTELADWCRSITKLDPWDERLHDIVIPMHSATIESATEIIVLNAQKEILKTTESSAKRLRDFALASRVDMALVDKQPDVDVEADDGRVTIVLKKYVLRLDRYKKELTEIASAVPGVSAVDVRIGKTFQMPSNWPPVDIEVPQKVLLVDDEREFVQTLSERLQTRDMEPAIAYDGEEALSLIEKDEPEVMVLDLKMPGIDGIEVLRRVKKSHPDTEVIILTGHGSEREKQLASELGAFAYLEKPVDIDVLARTMKEAYAKVGRGKSRKGKSDGTEE